MVVYFQYIWLVFCIVFNTKHKANAGWHAQMCRVCTQAAVFISKLEIQDLLLEFIFGPCIVSYLGAQLFTVGAGDLRHILNLMVDTSESPIGGTDAVVDKILSSAT